MKVAIRQKNEKKTDFWQNLSLSFNDADHNVSVKFIHVILIIFYGERLTKSFKINTVPLANSNYVPLIRDV